jgi:hypothetical protein
MIRHGFRLREISGAQSLGRFRCAVECSSRTSPAFEEELRDAQDARTPSLIARCDVMFWLPFLHYFQSQWLSAST